MGPYPVALCGGRKEIIEALAHYGRLLLWTTPPPLAQSCEISCMLMQFPHCVETGHVVLKIFHSEFSLKELFVSGLVLHSRKCHCHTKCNHPFIAGTEVETVKWD